jgi:ATP-binding cassette, subfamily C (CFTR/MRP), member 1
MHYSNNFSFQHRTLTVLQKFRNILTIGLVIAYMSNILSPFLTFASYTGLSIQGHGVLDSTRLFTTLSIISLLTTPMNIALQMYPTLMAAFACLGRIEEFGFSEDFEDGRLTTDQPKSAAPTETKSDLNVNLRMEKSLLSSTLQNEDAIVGTNVSFGWEDGNIVENANFRIKYGQVTVLRGLNGSGKSTLLKALLGELPLSQGSIHISTRDIAFCDQTAWLPNATVQNCILGYNVFDSALYGEVLHACALYEDLSQMEEGDRTKIGNTGAVRVSGGQMHRISLARAIYAQRRIYLLDDVLAGLDNRTQNVICHRLFSRTGILKRLGVAVVVVTPLSRHLDWADQVLTISEDRSVAAMDSSTKEGGSVDKFDEINHVASQPNHVLHPQELLGATYVSTDRSRQIGDWAVYKYYAWSIGAVNCAIYIAFGVIYTFLTKFPGKSFSP